MCNIIPNIPNIDLDLKNDIEIMSDILQSFEEGILFSLTLKGIKHTSLSQDIIITNEQRDILKNIALKYNKNITFVYIDIDENSSKPYSIIDDVENIEVDIYLSSSIIDESFFNLPHLEHEFKLGSILGFPVSYNYMTYIIKKYIEKCLLRNVFRFKIVNPPLHMSENLTLDSDVIVFCVYKSDFDYSLEKSNIWLHEINNLVKSVYPETSIKLHIEDEEKEEDDEITIKPEILNYINSIYPFIKDSYTKSSITRIK